ncbi:protein late bloomer [Drosophila obscura]|uniref:protein late bloomer n=1 Tax=Drosophila obscura TaxID=7282 RepID=UPI001BB1A1C5|nr:protein late bloomer [Drosophila obscura]
MEATIKIREKIPSFGLTKKTPDLAAPEPSREEIAPPVTKIHRKCTLTICQWFVYSLTAACLALNISDMFIYVKTISGISGCGRCIFLQYQIILMVVVGLVVFLLCVIPVVVLKQSVQGLRTFVMLLFLATWLQMMMIVLLSHDYPLVHDIEKIWTRHKSLDFYEHKYECCGMTGPIDYKLAKDEVPSSCFKDRSMRSQDLYKSGCATKRSRPSDLALTELLTIACQYVLIVVILFHKMYLKRNLVPARSLRALNAARIHLPP